MLCIKYDGFVVSAVLAPNLGNRCPYYEPVKINEMQVDKRERGRQGDKGRGRIGTLLISNVSFGRIIKLREVLHCPLWTALLVKEFYKYII